MIENTVFLLGFSVLLLIVSPILAIMERLFLGFGAILMILILGIIILSSPLFFITGIVLIITNSSGTGIHLSFSVSLLHWLLRLYFPSLTTPISMKSRTCCLLLIH